MSCATASGGTACAVVARCTGRATRPSLRHGPAAILVVVDGPAHADGLRRVVSRLGASAGSGGSALAVAVSGGLRGACSGIAPRLGLPAAACDERRLRVFDMNLGRDLPTFGHTAVGTSSGGVVVGAPQLAPEPAAPVRTARLEAEALADLSQIVRTVRPSLLVSLDDSSSPTSRATARLAKLGGPPSLALPLAGPAWAIDCLGSLTVPQLHRWGVEPLTIAVFASSVSSPASTGGVRDVDEEDLTDDARLAALHDSLRSAAACAAVVAALPGTPLFCLVAAVDTHGTAAPLSHCCCPLTPRPWRSTPRRAGGNGRGSVPSTCASAWDPSVGSAQRLRSGR